MIFFGRFLLSQIYDPRATTTKPPERRESILPWHSAENKSRNQIEPRFLKWQQQSRDNIPSKSDTKNWSPWQKALGSEIEQRTQIDGESSEQNFEQISEKIPEQQRRLEFDKSEQRENLKPPVEYRDLTYFDKNRGHVKNETKYGNRPQNEIDFEDKYLPRNDEIKEINVGFQDEDYEGVAIDSTVIFKNFKQICSYKLEFRAERIYSKNYASL